MKSTFLLSLFVLTVRLSHAQTPPCNITKLDWQTAFTSEEGSVSYFMESSDCKGKEICGQPKIGLKHSFKKPIWIKVKLKGFNCDNQAILGEFYTNRTYITANEVYVAKHNWHTFKIITEVVNVEVAFEETKVQSIIFNKDGNTLDTYVDGKYQKKGPSPEELKAAAQDSIKKAQLLAAAEQAKKDKNKVLTPSVKNAVIEKIPTAKAPVGQKNTEKGTKNPTAKVNTSPSVKNAIVEKKPTTKAPIGQKSVEKQVKKPTTKETNSAQKNTNVAQKPTTGTANGQSVADKPAETPATKSNSPVKMESQMSLPQPSTTATQEALKKATEPTVSEQNTPSVKTEKMTPDQASVKSAVQQNANKAPQVTVAKETTPSVKPKNIAPPTTNQGKGTTQATNQPVTKATNQTANKATQRPTEKPTDRPQAYMPTKKTQKTVDAVSATPAPPIIEREEGPLNVLKTNILYPISLGYEHGLGAHFSFFVSGFFMPALGFSSTTNTIRNVNLAKPSVGFAAEARYYISKTKAPLNGLYWGGFYSTRSAEISLHIVSATTTTTTDATIKIPLGLQMYGLTFGKQRIRSGGFTTDFNLGLGYYNLFGIPTISPNAEGVFGRIGELTTRKTGIAPRLNINLGYAF